VDVADNQIALAANEQDNELTGLVVWMSLDDQQAALGLIGINEDDRYAAWCTCNDDEVHCI
jgi:hypothetical protein